MDRDTLYCRQRTFTQHRKVWSFLYFMALVMTLFFSLSNRPVSADFSYRLLWGFISHVSPWKLLPSAISLAWLNSASRLFLVIDGKSIGRKLAKRQHFSQFPLLNHLLIKMWFFFQNATSKKFGKKVSKKSERFELKCNLTENRKWKEKPETEVDFSFNISPILLTSSNFKGQFNAFRGYFSTISGPVGSASKFSHKISWV